MPAPTPRSLTPAEAHRRGRRRRWAARAFYLVLPGLGQLIEGRFVAGCFFMLLCLGGLALALIPVVHVLLVFGQFMIAMLNDTQEPPIDSGMAWGPLIAGIAIVLVACVWSVADVGRRSSSAAPGASTGEAGGEAQPRS